MRLPNNRENQGRAGSSQKCLKPRKAVAAAAVKVQPTLKWAWWMCVRFSVKNSEAKHRCEGGPVTLDLTKWDFNKADCRNKCIKLIENSKPLLLTGSPIDSGREDKERARATLHLAFFCELYEIQVHGGQYFLHAHPQPADSLEQSSVLDFMNRFPDTFQTVTDRRLFGPDLPHGMNTLTRWLTNSGCVAQAISSLNHSSTVDQTTMSAMSQQSRSELCAATAKHQPQHRPLLPKLDILAMDLDEEPPEEREAEDDVKGGPLDPHEAKNAREKEVKYLWDMKLYEYSTEAEARARTGRNPVGFKWIDTTKEAPKPHVTVRVWCVRMCATKESSRSCRQHLRWKLCESYSVLRVRKTCFELRTLS